MTNPLRFDGTVSLGNLLVILALIATVIAAWTANRERTLSNARAIERMSGEMHDLEQRVRAVENSIH
jgi:hypothetical protein